MEEINGEPNSFTGYCEFSSKKNKDMKIKDKKNHKISESDLKVGDIIKIIGKKEKMKIAIGHLIEPLYNIKSVKIVGQDIEGASDTYIFNRTNNVSFMINEFNNKGITFTIIDKNERTYEYNHDYVIYKKVQSEPKTLKSHSSQNSKKYKPKAMKQKITEKEIIATTIPSKLPTEPINVDRWEKLEKVSEISSKETVEFDKKLTSNIFIRKYDWSKMYGELEKRKL